MTSLAFDETECGPFGCLVLLKYAQALASNFHESQGDRAAYFGCGGRTVVFGSGDYLRYFPVPLVRYARATMNTAGTRRTRHIYFDLVRQRQCDIAALTVGSGQLFGIGD